MPYTTPSAEMHRADIDAIIFDMDGVLLDITDSIRVIACLAVPYYLRTVLGWPAPDDLVTSQDIEMFKNAGGFNDDIDLVQALVLHYIAKGHEHPMAAPDTLNVIQPKLNRYAARIADRGGWLRAAENIAFENLSAEDRLAVETDYRKPLIKQVFLEMFAGDLSERLYGAPATLYTGPGYIYKDKPLLDLAKLPPGIPLGLQTGRTREEAQVGLELCGLAGHIPDDHIITKNSGFPKPLPGGLRLLAKRMGFRTAVYIGDTRDDLRTVQAFNADRAEGDAVFLSAQVLTGPLGKTNEKMFRQSGADIVANDVNDVLDWVSAEHG